MRPTMAAVNEATPRSHMLAPPGASGLRGVKAAGQGLEPRLPDPESGVLPLDDPATGGQFSRLRSVFPAPVLRTDAFLRRAAGGCHRHAFLDDNVARIRVPVLLALHTAARIALAIEGVHVAFLLVRAVLLALFPPANHESIVPHRR